jgi:ELWxxDGT repeat protein
VRSGRYRRGEQLGENVRARGEPRIVPRPEIDDGAARARGTREPCAPCARLLDPVGTRAHATQTAGGSNCANGATPTARPAKPRVRREAVARRAPARNRRRCCDGTANGNPAESAANRNAGSGPKRALAAKNASSGYTARGSSIPARAPTRHQRRRARIARAGATGHGLELGKSDGTTKGTKLAKDIAPAAIPCAKPRARREAGG